MTTMKVLACMAPYQLQYREMNMPTVTEGNTLLRIRRVCLCGTDLHAFEGTQPYLEYPRILGHELAGEIASTNAAGFKVGDIVTIIPYFHCGHCIACRNGKPNCCTSIRVCGVHIDGALSEYLVVPDYSLVHGRGLSDQQLALVEPLSIGAHGVARAAIKKDEFVLIVGAGPIGLGTMELAKMAGAQVIIMDVQDNRLAFCREKLNTRFTINPSKVDAADELSRITNGDMPTVIIDATGNRNAINNSLKLLAHGGRYVLIGLQKDTLVFSHPEFHKRETTLMSSRNAVKADFDLVIDALRQGIIDPTLFINHTVSFGHLGDEFEGLLDPSREIIKTVVEM